MEKYKIILKDDISKYIQIYNHIKNLIAKSEIKENEKLPPIRKLAQIIGVNNTTVVKVYELLENEGYVYKIIGSGTFVSIIKKDQEEVFIKKEGIIRLDNGNPTTEIFPVDEFRQAINMALDKEGNTIFEYEDGLGCLKLRNKMVQYLKTKGISTSKDNVQIISGAQQGIDIVCKGLIDYSDIVFVEEPTYSGAIEVFKSKGAKIISIPMLDDGIDIGILKLKLEKIKPKLIYTMPNFQNPTGISYSLYKKKKLIELAEEYDFYILEDDFISDFKFESQDNNPLRSYDDKDRVIYIKSFSKILMPGLRIGIIDIPSELLKKILWAKHSSDISTPGLIQKSMYYYMEHYDWNKYLNIAEKTYTKRYNLAKEIIQNKLSNRLKVKNGSGGINFFLELPRGYLSKDFVEFMLEKGVSILPGYYFFDNILDDRFFRINIAKSSIHELEKGISIISDNLDEFLEKYKSAIKVGNNKMFFKNN